mgnify:CR=1 FL=1
MMAMANIELPKDAEGREIPLDTTVLYDEDGKEIEVSRYQYYPKVGPGYWNLKSVRNKYYRMDEVHLTPPDSWEKLEEDLDRCIKEDCLCPYSPSEECSECILPRDSQNHCDSIALEDIKERIRKLRGEDE